MVCTYCFGKTQVVNSRRQQRRNAIWRRRRCLSCSAVFTTSETAELSQSLVVATDNAVEPFNRDKLLIDVYDSLRHRKKALRDATALTDTIINKLPVVQNHGLLTKTKISEITYKTLRLFDTAAATHFNAFHPSQAQEQ